MLLGGVLVAACEPPPPSGDLTGDGTPPGGISLDILYPNPGETLLLDATCVLREPLIVHIRGIDLVQPDPGNVVEGQGHWHGGPDLTEGYCVSDTAYCVGSDEAVPGTYDGSVARAGNATLFVTLQDNAHTPLGIDAQVEVFIEEPPGGCP